MAGATSGFAAEGADAARGLCRAPKPLVSLGHQTVYYEAKGERALVWRDHNVVAVLYSRGLSASDLAKLAHVQEARIQRALRSRAIDSSSGS